MRDIVDLHIALVGCGAWGRHILRDLRDLGARVTVVARSDESVTRARDGGGLVVPHVDALATGDHVDGVVVATPTITHGSVLESVLDLEVPIFVEKPMTADLASAQRLVDVAGDRIFVMDKWRYHPGIQRLGEVGRSGDYGRMQGLVTTRHQWGSGHADVDAVWILAPHDLSVAVEILGYLPEPAHAVFEEAEGRVTGMRALLQGEQWHAMSISTRSPVWERSVVVHTDDAIIVLHDSFDDHLSVYASDGLTFGDPPEPERIPIAADMPLRGELEAFLGYLRGGPPPKTTAVDGLASIQWITRLRALSGVDSSP